MTAYPDPHPHPSAAPSHANPRVLLIISAQPPAGLDAAVAAGREPRRDYQALQAALSADLLTPADARRTSLSRLIARVAGPRVALAWTAFRRRRAYDVLYSDGENVGLPLAMLLKLRRVRPGSPRHVMLTHYLSTRPKRLLFRLGAASHIDTLIVHSSAQRQRAITTLRVPPARVALLPYFADANFWRASSADQSVTPPPDPSPPPPADPSISTVLRWSPPTVCAVGLEFRDYDTLARAARGLNARVRIAAASSWSHHSAFTGTPSLPANVAVQSYTYLPLRDLYASASVVVVPLRDVDNQAGITVILEAMAMGKPVVVTATRGQTDVVRDRRNGGFGRVARAHWPSFAEAPALASSLASLPTGFYVAPADPDELRRAIQYLLDHPELAATLGANARRHVEALYTLDAFAARFAAILRGELPPLLPFSPTLA